VRLEGKKNIAFTSEKFRFYYNRAHVFAVSTVTVTAVRGSLAWLPCDIGGGNNDGLPMQLKKVAGRTKDSGNAPEDRAYMVLWFKHQNGPTIRHRNSKFKNNKMSSGGKPLYR